MEQYQPNSRKFKEEQKEAAEKKKVEKVITGTAKIKKKSEIRKFTDVFVSEDASNVKSYIFSDVLIPAIKKLVSDIVTDGVDMILYGGTGRRDRSQNSKLPYISYNRFSDRRDDRRQINEPRPSVGYSFGDVTLPTYGEAQGVLSAMDDLIARYGVVSVADLYDLVGVTGNFTDNKYGWMNISNAEAVRVRDGYMLKLPKAAPID